jgi:acetolactate synthase-1/2/3 large subunit
MAVTPKTKTQTVAAALVDALRELGVRYVFGVPSGGWVDYMEALRVADGIEFVLTTHEGAAGMMADVCGRLGAAPGVCFGTFGPGATNLATGVGGALLDRSPMIAFTDEMPAAMRGRTTQMGIDHQALFRPLTKATTRLDAAHVRSIVFEAARTALRQRMGPVHVGLPVGLSAVDADTEAVPYLPPDAPPNAPDAKLDEVVRVARAARRPLLAVGLGAVRAGMRVRIERLAHRHRLPVVLTPMAKGMFPESDPLYTGVLFHALSDVVGETHAQADVVIAVGYDPVEFNYESWLSPQAQLVSIDVEPADIDRAIYPHVVDAVGEIGHSLDVLLALPPLTGTWDLAAIAERRKRMFARLEPAPERFGPAAALHALRRSLPLDAIMTCDVGAHTHLIGQLWPTPEPGLQLMTNGWSTMGFGIPSAIAAKLMHPERTVCTVVGDGGFLMTAGELATAVRLNLNIIVLLLTDDDLALIRIKQEKKGYPVYGTPVRSNGTRGLGDAVLGVPVSTVRTRAALDRALTEALRADGPVIVEALVDSREYDDLVLKKDRP